MSNNGTAAAGILRVAELARLARVTPATVRYYSRIGLLSPGREPDNGYRSYAPSDTRRVNFIRRAQALGLAIDDIRAILAMIDEGEEPCGRVRSLVESRLASVRREIKQLEALEQRIAGALMAWEEMETADWPSDDLCPLIEAVSRPKADGRAGDPASCH